MPHVVDFKPGPGAGTVTLILEWPTLYPWGPEGRFTRYSEMVVNLGEML